MRLLACALFWAGAAMLLSALVGGAAASASAAYWAQPLPSDEYIPLDVIYDESAFSPAHADELSELSADETVFLELEPGADAESAFLSVDEAEELTRGLPVDSGHSIYTESRKVGKPADLPDRGVWKKIGKLEGPHARLKAPLSRVLTRALERVNTGVQKSGRYEGCRKVDNLQMKVSETSVQYRLRCAAKVDSMPDRQLLLLLRDRFGVVDLLDWLDRGELSPFTGGFVDGPEFDGYKNAWYLPQVHVKWDDLGKGV